MTSSVFPRQSTPTSMSAIQTKLLNIQAIMRLQDWDIVISNLQPQSDTHQLEISINRRRKHAAIRISHEALFMDSEEFDHCLVHECTHLIFDELDFEYIKDERYDELRERAVDHIAKVMYTAISQSNMPL